MGGHHSARMDRDEWITPRDILSELGPFDLDPCAPLNPPWKTAAVKYDLIDDGLTKPWFGFVWCNPPYGLQADAWLAKMAEHNNGIALIFARTETEMFFDRVWSSASSIMFLRGRLFFHFVNGERARTNCGAPSVLVGFGSRARDKIKNCSFAGAFVEKWASADGCRAGQKETQDERVARVIGD